ncbi:MAG: CapA family protein [Lachnospiraceae bacterium]|nr:CapA family protein [Lachnospiraceae bacterium]
MKLLIGGDIVPTASNQEYFITGDMEKIIGKRLRHLLSEADFSVFNLEAPLTDERTPILKSGPALSVQTGAAHGLYIVNPYFFTLANNHIMDQGEQGLRSTMEILDRYKIRFGGVGKNAKEAREPYIYEREGRKIGIYCCSEYEFSIAGSSTPGANWFDPLESPDDITRLKENCDYVLVLYHAGKEYYRYPSPNLQKVCRKMVDKGADVVVCQHSHCVGCEERWQKGVIVYGQGNFLFDYSDHECWKTGILVELVIDEKGLNVKYHAVTKIQNGVEAMDEMSILDGFAERSKQISEEGMIEKLYSDFSERKLIDYEMAMLGRLGRNYFFRGLNKLLKHRLAKMFYTRQMKAVLWNYITCEAHREIFLEGLSRSWKRDKG